jgi:rhomboid protease GluP
VLLFINFGLFAACALFSSRAGTPQAFMNIDVRTLIRFGASLPPGLETWWRLITAGFLHGGLLHILMNSWVLFDIGAQVEEIYGGARFLVFYFVSTIAGFAASSYLAGNLSVGASAALFGLIGAMLALGVHHPLGRAIRPLYTRWVIYMLLLGLLPGLHIDMAAHLGGLAAGFGTAYVAGLPKIGNPTAETAWRIAAGVAIGLTALAFFNMYLFLSSPVV